MLYIPLHFLRLSNSAHVDFVHGLSWHPTEPYLVTCSWDGQVLQHSVDISSGEGDVTVSRIDVVEDCKFPKRHPL